MARQTRRERAIELRAKLKRGPSFTATFLHLDGIDIPTEHRKKLEAEMTAQYRQWAESWIIGTLEDLLPKELSDE